MTGGERGEVSGRRPPSQLSSLLQMLRFPSIHVRSDLSRLLFVRNVCARERRDARIDLQFRMFADLISNFPHLQVIQLQLQAEQQEEEELRA